MSKPDVDVNLVIDIKKLWALEKGKQLPDSGIIWKMYDCFRISPVFILNDPKGLLDEVERYIEEAEEMPKIAQEQQKNNKNAMTVWPKT